MKKWKCTVCGYIHTGEEPPDICPVCGADKSEFVEVTEEKSKAADEETTASVELQEEPQKTTNLGKVTDLMLKFHIHPISVHMPNGLIPVAFLFFGLAAFFQLSSFDLPGFYNLIFVLLTMPVVLYTGYLEWVKRYKGARTPIFITKIICGVVVMVTLVFCILWRFVDPEVTDPSSPARWVFLLFLGIMVAATVIGGHLGGKLALENRGR